MKFLDAESIEKFRTDGYLAPIRVISEAQAETCRVKLEDYEQSTGGPICGIYRFKLNLLFRWADELVRNERILDPVEDLLGPNILCWNSNLFIKEAGDPKYVAWHQDSPYQGMSESEGVAAWVALAPSTIDNGALQVIPGSHTRGDVVHRETDDELNQLMRHQEIAVDLNEDDAVHLILKPGEMSLHHTRIIHSSAPNTGDHRRLGLAIRYIPTHIHQVAGSHDSVALVRGVDEFGHYELEPRPRSDFDPETMALHLRYADNQANNLTRDLQAAR
jgi:hypothetical protein